ncbi:hypothetical protein [Elizabethkingia meningoseptica]|uniref:hypothetical protein n=1 Tax=Elizabethkingia meningoseptica TaxID=238 RepID=UPI00389215DD
MNRKITYIIISIILVGLIYILFRPDAIVKAIFTAKIQNQVPTVFQGKFAEKENKHHVFSAIHEGGYPVSFYRVPNKYDFGIYAFDGISNNIQDIKFMTSDNPFESIINQVHEGMDFILAKIHYFKDNIQGKKVQQIRFNGKVISKKKIANGSYIFKTEGKYEIFLNEKRVFFIDTDTENYIIIKNEGKFYQICILEIYDDKDKEQIISRFETY